MNKLTIYILALSIIRGCKKEPEPVNNQGNEKPVIRVDDQEILDYFYSYKNNSWWVYEDEATCERASAFMASKDKGSTVNQYNAEHNTERIGYALHWQKLPIMYVYLESSLTPNVYSISYGFRSGDVIKENGVYRTKDTRNSSVDLLDSISFNGFTFYNVLKVNLGGDHLYYAKNVGIVRRHITYKAKDFKLKKYQIN